MSVLFSILCNLDQFFYRALDTTAILDEINMTLTLKHVNSIEENRSSHYGSKITV